MPQLLANYLPAALAGVMQAAICGEATLRAECTAACKDVVTVQQQALEDAVWLSKRPTAIGFAQDVVPQYGEYWFCSVPSFWQLILSP